MFRKKLDIYFICSSKIDSKWIQSTFEECNKRNLKTAIAICDNGFKEASKIKCHIAVTASSGLNRNIFPTKARWFIHMPHSLASLHMIYPPGTFDGYDYLFSAGPHHDHEFSKLTGRRSFPVGYGKLDLLQSKNASTDIDVLIAPSWGPDNLMDKCGVELALSLKDAGYSVIVRPHPLFILEKAGVIEKLKKLQVDIESPFESDVAITKARLMIGDWSGTSFEFVALNRRPVISVNVGKKNINPNWEEINCPPVEIDMRSKLGPVVEPDIGQIIVAVESCLEEKIVIKDEVINEFLHAPPGQCATRATDQLEALLAGSI